MVKRKETVMENSPPTILGPECTFKGELSTKGTIRIDGYVEGKISSDTTVIIGEKGKVKASITGGTVIVGGEVRGNVTVKDRLELLSTGRLFGDVKTPNAKFVVAEGVIFEGRCSMDSNAFPEKKVAKVPGAQAPEDKLALQSSKDG